jgi:hypothetical protein
MIKSYLLETIEYGLDEDINDSIILMEERLSIKFGIHYKLFQVIDINKRYLGAERIMIHNGYYAKCLFKIVPV